MAKRPAKSPAPEGDDPAPPIAAGPNVPELSVSELANALKRTVEDRFGHVRVRGEITNYRGPHSSGHVYFSLKDQNARLDAVIWKMTFLRLRVKPQEGLEVVATGKISTFPGKSSYQIVIETLEPAGAGALMALLDERRKRLAAEGLFDAERKKPLPFLPLVVGVVTSPTGAVIRDISASAAGSFSAPRAGVAGSRAGRDLRGGSGRRHRRLQRSARRRANSAAGCADRRARRRLARGFVRLQ